MSQKRRMHTIKMNVNEENKKEVFHGKKIASEHYEGCV